MIRKASLGVALVASLMMAAPSHAGVTVRFINPERYTDVASAGDPLAVFRAYLEKLGERYLAPGQNLTIDILDVDLAGEIEPWHPRFSDTRILRDVTPPRFKLRYSLSEKGRRVRNGEADLSDLNYQSVPHSSTDRYFYEKTLLEDWFRQNFAQRR